MVTERQLKIAYILGHFGSVMIRTTQYLQGAPQLIFPIGEIETAINDVLERAGDPIKLGKVSREEIKEILKLLNLEDCIYETEEEN